MKPFLQEIKVAFGETHNFTVEFNEGLNIISGENGTGKTQLLKQIKNNQGCKYKMGNEDSSVVPTLSSFSPKRTSQKQQLASTHNLLRTQTKEFDQFLAELSNKHIQDVQFENFPSFVECFLRSFEHRTKDGASQREHLISTTSYFNNIIASVFPDYLIITNWNETIGKPDIQIKIGSRSPVDVEFLSCGQQEVISLLFNLDSAKEKSDVILIDEPETHLNWRLEKSLFAYFEKVCKEHRKQIIVVTHSRIIITNQFKKYCHFLFWVNTSVQYSRTIPQSVVSSIVGELNEVIQVIAPNEFTFFVEDKDHEKTIQSIAEALNKQVITTICDGCENVKQAALLSADPSSSFSGKGYYLVDGDNQGDPKDTRLSLNDRFIKLDQYCINCYFFDTEILTTEFKVSKFHIVENIVSSIKERKKELYAPVQSAPEVGFNPHPWLEQR